MGDLPGVMAILERIEARCERIEANQEKLEASQARLRADAMERIDRLQDAVESMRADITVNFGRADFVQRFANNLRTDLLPSRARSSGGAAKRWD